MDNCINCEYFGEIYYPPTMEQEAIRLNGCFYFSNHPDGKHNEKRSVMYLGDNLNIDCECFKKKVRRMDND